MARSGRRRPARPQSNPAALSPVANPPSRSSVANPPPLAGEGRAGVAAGRAAPQQLGRRRSDAKPAGSAFEVFRIFLRLGLTSFGGPVAHLGYYRSEFVERRKWLDEHTYADIVALWQFLPGPTSSQVGITLGIMRAGFLGALAAWIGFTMPSAAAMILFGYGLTR